MTMTTWATRRARAVVGECREAGVPWTVLSTWRMGADERARVAADWPELAPKAVRRLIGEIEQAVRQCGAAGLPPPKATRGGARAGAGRPPLPASQRASGEVRAWVTPAVHAELSAWSEREGRPLSALVIEAALERARW